MSSDFSAVRYCERCLSGEELPCQHKRDRCEEKEVWGFATAPHVGNAWIATVGTEEAMKQVSPLADRIRASLPRKRQKGRKRTQPKDKTSRYRVKLINDGRCPHCGKPCAPFYECAERRAKKKLYRIMKGLVKKGTVRVAGKDGSKLLYETVRQQPGGKNEEAERQ